MKNKFFILSFSFVFFGIILGKNIDCNYYTDEAACNKNRIYGCTWERILKKCSGGTASQFKTKPSLSGQY